MRGFLESDANGIVKGWAFDERDPEQAIQIKVSVDKREIAAGRTGIPREDVRRKFGTRVNGFGFEISIQEDIGQSRTLVVEASSGGDWRRLDDIRRRNTGTAQYQRFEEGTGASNSSEKLKALRLASLGFGGAKGLLDGRSVLDIGCNEGFFCVEAIKQGASRVVGIDLERHWIDLARKRCPEADFRVASWWEAPEEKFDVILFLSAIHYEPEQQRLLDKLSHHLTPDGVLILECGVFGNDGRKYWTTVQRQDGPRRYPSFDLLVRNLLRNYSVRYIQPSVSQAGDPIPRHVFHCSRAMNSVVLIQGRPRSGKTALTRQFSSRGVASFSTDVFISSLVRPPAGHLPAQISRKLNEVLGNNPVMDIGFIDRKIIENELIDEFVASLLDSLPLEEEVLLIEGEILSYQVVSSKLYRALEHRAIRVWMTRMMDE